MTALRVLHVTTSRQRRGGEVFAADLVTTVAELAPGEIEQHVATLRSDGDLDFGVPTTAITARPRAGVIGVALGLRAVIASVEPAVIQTHGGDALRAAVLALPAAPIVHRRIGPSPAAIRSGWRRRWHRALLGRAAMIVPVAEHIRRDDAIVFGIPDHKVRVVPNAVRAARISTALERPAARRALGIDQSAVVILSLGSLSHDKEPLRAIDASAPLLCVGVHHLFVGDGPLTRDVLTRASALGVDSWVQVLPAQPDVGTALAAADLLLFCSRSEGMPGVLIEAGLAGLAVVGQRVAGVDEVVEDGVTGALVPPADVAGLTEALRRVVDDDRLRAEMGAAGRLRCRQRFDLARVARTYVELWREASPTVDSRTTSA